MLVDSSTMASLVLGCRVESALLVIFSSFNGTGSKVSGRFGIKPLSCEDEYETDR